MLADFVKFILTILGAVFASLLSYELIEVGKKRKIETYWKIEAEYKSEAQQTARKSREEVTEALENQRFFLQKDFSADDLDKKLVDFYNTEFHYSNDKTKRDKAWE